jgi:integrase
MSVYRPKGGRFFHYDFWYKKERYTGPTGAVLKSKALIVEAAKREAVALAVARSNGAQQPRAALAPPTLDVAASEWWEGRGRGLGRASEEKQRGDALELAVDLVGAKLLITEIRTSDISSAIQKRRGMLVRGKTPPANATVNKAIVEIIRPVIRMACEARDLAPPPIAWAKVWLQQPKPKPRDFKGEDFERIVDTLPAHWRDFARFQARYGCRLGEMFFLPSDIDVAGRRLRLRDRKGGDDHVLPLLDEDVAMLAARKGRAEAAKLSTVWFRELKGGRLKALAYNGGKQAMRRVMRDTGLHASQGAKGSHDYRRHAAITVLRQTGNLMVTKNLLGHANIQSTMVYAAAVEDDLRAALEGLSRPCPGGAKPAPKKSDKKQRSKE